jgi:hypothetical protein
MSDITYHIGGLIRKYTEFDYYPFEFARRDSYTEMGLLIESGSGYAPGKILEFAQGDVDGIALSEDGYLMAPDQVMTHTHPNDSPLSMGDMMWMCSVGFGEVRAAHDSFLESMVPGRRLELEDWYYKIRPTITRIGTEMGLFHENYTPEYSEGGFATQSYVANYDIELERFPLEEILPWHDLWEDVAREHGMTYKVMKW